MFSLHRRLNPCGAGSSVVYSDLLNTFGVRPHTPSHLLTQRESAEREFAAYLVQTQGKENTPEIETSIDINSKVKVEGNLHRQVPDRRDLSLSPGREVRPDNLTSLPFEVLQHIARYVDEMKQRKIQVVLLCDVVRFLDGFSLNNLSLASVRLRDVCCSLLEERGLVTIEWSKRSYREQQLNDGTSVRRPAWKISRYVSTCKCCSPFFFRTVELVFCVSVLVVQFSIQPNAELAI